MHFSTAPALRRTAVAVLAATLWLWAPAAGAHAVPGVAPAPAKPATAPGVTWSVTPADNKLGTGRPHFTYTLPQGTRITDAVDIANRGDRPITLRVYASDAFTTPTGGLDLLPAGRGPTDVGSWIAPRTSTLTLAPQQSRTVSFTVTVPSGATPGDHTGGIVTSLVTSGTGDGVTLDRRLGSRVYLRVPGVLTPSLRVSSVHARYDGTANPVGIGRTHLTYTVTNNGNIRLTARQQVRISGLFGALSGSTALPDLPELLPGDALTRTAVVGGVWPAGPLQATVSLRPLPATDGSGQAQPQPTTLPVTASGHTTVWAWPWALLAVAAVLAVVVRGQVWLRRRHRRKVAAAIGEAVGEALTGSRPPATKG
ncbi:DUF916 domain-containing protein [Streptomyces sp. NBC_01476]|uniref:WxL protein peptidoglycan domain-containing protein n=1 Tax=Streptomyces sp. NBC_01476 TaxID=2903881 RepID=UPI002E30CA86|nr:DUF916 domain-containing protein [Streptomyces sp. NBC_01476]